MVDVNGRCWTLYDVACRIYDANMMLRAIAELDVFQSLMTPIEQEVIDANKRAVL